MGRCLLTSDCAVQVYIANNQQLLSLAGDNATTARPGALKTIGGQLIIGNNPAMTALAGLEQLEHVGGPVSIPCQFLVTRFENAPRAVSARGRHACETWR